MVLARGRCASTRPICRTRCASARSCCVRGGPPGPTGAEAAAPEGVFQIRIGHAARRGRGARCSRRRCASTTGNKTLTASMLGIDPKTVFRKLKAGRGREERGRRARRSGQGGRPAGGLPRRSRYEVADGVAHRHPRPAGQAQRAHAVMLDELLAVARPGRRRRRGARADRDRARAARSARAPISRAAARPSTASPRGRGEAPGEHRDGGGRVTLRIFDMKKPMIAAINGPAVGFGITMTLPMDIRIASTAARIGFVFARRGVVPEACSTWFLPRLVGIEPGRGVGVHRARVPGGGGARGRPREPRGPAGAAPAGGARAGARDRARTPPRSRWRSRGR